MAEHNTTGRLGEDLAAKYLAAKGFVILQRNWRYSHYEIDIIATLKNTLHFIEVKTRRSNKYGYPEDDVSKRKLKFLINSAEEYQHKNPGWKLVQFDILSITLGGVNAIEYFLIEDVAL